MIYKVHFIQILEFPLDSILFHFSFMAMIPQAPNLQFEDGSWPDLCSALEEQRRHMALLELLKSYSEKKLFL